MRRLSVALALVIIGGLLWPLAQRAATLPAAPRTFRIVTFNIHKGADLHHYDLERTIEAISRLNPDVVGVQEAMRNHPDFNCDDQPALIAAGLSRRTGRTWTHVFEKAWITDHRKCLESGRGDDTETEGLALFAHEPIVMSSAVRLSEGRVGLSIRVASMPTLPIVVTHLSANQSGQDDREREIAKLLPWAARQGPGILIGDFNARPDTSELQPVMAQYHDSWAEALAAGHAGGVMTGSTRPGRRVSRIDYVFYMPDAPLALESVDIVDTSTFPGLGMVSDHHPVAATFKFVNP
jgi:endonuclease/exonuclease/phosphatase family metal-dependent hydrolase